jgi:hypothetical protein
MKAQRVLYLIHTQVSHMQLVARILNHIFLISKPGPTPGYDTSPLKQAFKNGQLLLQYVLLIE